MSDLVRVAVRCDAVDVEYRTESSVVQAVRDVDAAFPEGRLSVLAGPSGSGKSSLLRVVAGLQRPTRGRVKVGGVELTGLRTAAVRRFRRHAIGYVFQRPSDNLLPYLTAAAQVRLTARLRGVDPGDGTELLEALGLSDRLDAYPAQLSGGEQQRLAFAAAAIGGPQVVVADEPTAELDDDSAEHLIRVLRTLVERSTTVIVASHDPAVVAVADRVVALHEGRAEVVR